MGFEGKILALDIASVTGWASGFVTEVPRCGRHDAKSKEGDFGDLGLSFGQFLQELIRAERPNAIAFEEPLDPRHLGDYTNRNTTAILYGLPFLAETIIKKTGIKVFQLEVRKIRGHFVPELRVPKKLKGDARKRYITKEVIGQCRNLGWHPTGGDEADALAAWSTARAYLEPKYALSTVPLPLEMPRAT